VTADPATFLSGESGTVTGLRLGLTRPLADVALRAAAALTLTGPRLDRLARATPRRSVTVVSVYRPDSRLPAALEALASDRHDVRFALGATADEADPALASQTKATGLSGRGKFQNLNRLLEGAGADWTLAVDDDVALPPRFTDRFLALVERLGFDVAQPAQTWRSHAAWQVTRRRPALARRTAFVEIGPVTAFSRRAAEALLPFPDLRWGWGLDNHWSAVAAEHGWSVGVVDALPVRHEWQPVAAGYTHAEAIEEASRFLADRSYVRTGEAQRTLATIRRLGS
jgi:hypothetical protein